MPTSLRIGTFNLENLDDKPNQKPTLDERIAVLRPQLIRMNADILCFQEVNGQEQTNQPRTLLALEKLLHNTPYQTYHVTHTKTANGEAYDERNLVVASRFPITSTQQIKHDHAPKPSYRKVTAVPAETTANDVTWERPMLYVALSIGAGLSLHVLVLHLKSKIPSDINGQKIDAYTWRTVAGWAEGSFISSMRRVGQALETRIVIDKIFDTDNKAMIAVCGDFNAEIDDVPVKAIRGLVEETGNPDLLHRIMVPCELTVPETSRYSLLHLGKGEMLDHILVSRSLLTHYKGTQIHNEILPDESGAFRTDVKFPESDHVPVMAEFVLP